MEIKRNQYLNQLISAKHNGWIKVITGLRRSGKSFLLNELFHKHLTDNNVLNDNIIYLSLDNDENEWLLDRKKLSTYLKKKIKNDQMYYILLDEIQLVKGFEKLLITLMQMKNVDIYVTGSNSKFLASDIITEFRGRGYQIHVSPLSYQEVYDFYTKNKEEYQELLDKVPTSDFEAKVYELYAMYGGLPQVVMEKNLDQKRNLIKTIFENIYMNDITQRYNIKNKIVFNSILIVLASTIGNIVNINKILNILKSEKIEISYGRLERYIGALQDAFLIYKIDIFDYANKRILESKNKLYFADLGIRNYLLGFLKPDHGFVMENILANHLIMNKLDIKTFQFSRVENINKKNVRKSYEIDFSFITGAEKYYIQSCYSLTTPEVYERENRILSLLDDSFKKFLVTRFSDYGGYHEKGIKNIELYFLLLDIKKYIKFDN